MNRKSEFSKEGKCDPSSRWFPYLDEFKAGEIQLKSSNILEALDFIDKERREAFQNVVKNRTYSVCLVLEGLSDLKNVSAAIRSADGFGFQSVHVISGDNLKRYKPNTHVSMGAEKWVDVELWDSTEECLKALKARGYRIATTYLGPNVVSVYDMDWSCPTVIVVGNENSGVSEKALELSDINCRIPMQGMVGSFNVAIASTILMQLAFCDRTTRLLGFVWMPIEWSGHLHQLAR